MATKKTTTKKVEKEEEKTPDVEVDKVEVSKEDLANFMKRLDSLEAENKKLLAVADKARLAHIEAKAQEGQKLIPEVALSRLDDKIIVAWKVTRNESRVEGNRMIEDQRIMVFFEDGTDKEISLKDFYRNVNKQLVAEVIARTKVEGTDKEMLKVQTKDGKELEIGLEFVN